VRAFLKKYSYKLLAWTIFILSLLFFYHRFYVLSNQIDENRLTVLFQNIDVIILIGVLVLVFVNWGIEAIKWQFVNKPLEPISLLSSFKAVLMGVAVSNIFPNRTGEFIGKVMVLSKSNRVKGILSSLLASLAQLSVTLLMGVGALLFISHFHYVSVLYIVTLTIITVLLFVFFKPIVRFLSHFCPKKWLEFIYFVKAYTFNDILKLIGLSLIRYMVFSFQLYLIFMALGVYFHIINFFHYAALSFLLTTIIPTTSLSELFVRSNIGVLIFSELNINDLVIIMAYTLLWIFNILLPSLLGFYLGLKKNWYYSSNSSSSFSGK